VNGCVDYTMFNSGSILNVWAVVSRLLVGCTGAYTGVTAGQKANDNSTIETSNSNCNS
jgi:hypothetical protein